jgi:hypothetical protein
MVQGLGGNLHYAGDFSSLISTIRCTRSRPSTWTPTRAKTMPVKNEECAFGNAIASVYDLPRVCLRYQFYQKISPQFQKESSLKRYVLITPMRGTISGQICTRSQVE